MLVVDTGVLYAAADDDDQDHAASTALLEAHPGPMLVPVPVIVETAWLVQKRLGPADEARFLRAVAVDFERVDLIDADWARVAELVDQYGDLDLGLVDASVVAVAERLGVIELATLDRRDFTVVRPRHVDAFTLLP